MIWFFTLQQRKNFEKVFLALAAPQRIAVQDTVRDYSLATQNT
jgi:hypothetical protein